MSPLNKTPVSGPRVPPVGMRPPLPRFGRLPPPGMPIRMAPPMPMSPMMGPRRMPGMPRPGLMMRPGLMPRPGGPPMYMPRGRGGPPMMSPMMGPRGMGMRPPMRMGPRGMFPPQVLPHMKPRYPPMNGTLKSKTGNAKKASKLEELELKKPWMTNEIRSEIQKKNKLYSKAKKSKDAKEWEEFKDLRNKVTRMIRDAKNEFIAKNPDQAHLDENGDALDTLNDLNEEMLFSDPEEEEVVPYCEVCDKNFTSQENLEEHIKEHRTCRIDGCTFTAHPKIVEKHISMQHSTGLYDRLKKYKDGDVDKWIAERKKKYPTSANVALRMAERLEKRKRGEVIQRQKRMLATKENKRNQNSQKRQSVEKPSVVNCSDKSSSLATNTSKNVPKIEETKETKTDDKDANSQNNSALGSALSLLAGYGSDSDDEPPEEIPAKKVRTEYVDNDVKEEPEKSSDKQTPSEEVRDNNTNDGETTNNATKIDRDLPVRRRNDYSKYKNNSKYSNGRLRLLHQLLAQDIQHERNIICQCIKYIADNNFFQ